MKKHPRNPHIDITEGVPASEAQQLERYRQDRAQGKRDKRDKEELKGDGAERSPYSGAGRVRDAEQHHATEGSHRRTPTATPGSKFADPLSRRLK